jgi:NADH-quinone oxidoreductase subunit N
MSLVYGIVVSTVPESGLTNTLTQFSTIAQVAGNNESFLLMLGIIFLIAGLGYKVALVPFHSWSPDVYQGAMTPITAFISTASKAAGFLLLFRVLTEAFPGFVGSATLETFGGWTSVLAVLALATVIIGNLAALPQQNAKRLLAYSSVAHAGFVVLALIAWASPLTMDRSIGVSSLLYYLVVYTVTNMGAFGALAVVSQSVGGDDIDDLNGLAQRNLGLAVLLTISVLSLAGIPPLSGFLAKFYVFMAAWQGGAWWLVITSIITTLISLYYYLRLLRAMFITGPEEPTPIKTPRTMNAVLVVAVALILLLGIYPNVVLTTIGQVQVATGM